MRVVVTGAAGLVGRALTAKYQAIGLTHRELDITDRAAIRRKMADLRPDLIINCDRQRRRLRERSESRACGER